MKTVRIYQSEREKSNAPSSMVPTAIVNTVAVSLTIASKNASMRIKSVKSVVKNTISCGIISRVAMIDDISQYQDTIYIVSHSGKIHVDKNCRYIRHRDDIREKSIDNYPNDWIELCEWCREYLNLWEDGIRLEDEDSECNRCGKRGIKFVYCDECYNKIRRIQS
jgi:hypothetical protein